MSKHHFNNATNPETRNNTNEHLWWASFNDVVGGRLWLSQGTHENFDNNYPIGKRLFF